MFSRKKKIREREKCDNLDGLPPTPTLPEEPPSTPDQLKETNKDCDSTENKEIDRESCVAQGESKMETALTPRERPSPRFPHRHPQLSTTSAERSTNTEESGLPEAHRSRVGSSASSVSAASSYHTTVSSHDTSSLQITGTVFEKEVVQLVSSLKYDLLHSMNKIQEKMTKLEGRIETIEQKLDSSVENMEKLETSMEEVDKRIQCVQSEMNNSQAAVTSSKDGAEEIYCHGLPALPEAHEECDGGANKAKNSSSSQLQQVSKKVSTAFRRFTDSEAAKVAHNRQILKRKKYAEKKSVSVQDSRHQLPQKQCSQQVIVWLTQRITHWKFIARWLGLQDSDVETIATNNPQDVREQCYQMFKKWRSTDPGNFTYHVLGEALKIESEVKLFNEYVEEVHRVENTIDVPDHD